MTFWLKYICWLTSADAAWNFIIIFNVACILFDEHRSCRTFQNGFRTHVFIWLALLLLDHSLLYLLLWPMAIIIHRHCRLLFLYLVHLHTLLLIFHFFISSSGSLTETHVHVLKLIALTIRTTFLHTTLLIASRMSWCVCSWLWHLGLCLPRFHSYSSSCCNWLIARVYFIYLWPYPCSATIACFYAFAWDWFHV